VLETLERLAPAATRLGTTLPLLSLAGCAARQVNDARWLRERFLETKSLSDVVRMQAARWRGEPRAPSRGS
jgi:gamma-glutamyl:cysteine ligase YbdK (ATP-grasp superfamily)